MPRDRVQEPLGPAMSALLRAFRLVVVGVFDALAGENLGYLVTVTALAITAAWTIGTYYTYPGVARSLRGDASSARNDKDQPCSGSLRRSMLWS